MREFGYHQNLELLKTKGQRNKMCDFPKCKQHIHLKYIGKNICKEHWDQLCNIFIENNDLSEGCTEKIIKKENKLLRKIGLDRDKDGMVGPISKSDLTK